jgi:hypothetical protein
VSAAAVSAAASAVSAVSAAGAAVSAAFEPQAASDSTIEAASTIAISFFFIFSSYANMLFYDASIVRAKRVFVKLTE